MCHFICLHSSRTPWKIPIKSSKYTSTWSSSAWRALAGRFLQFLSAWNLVWSASPLFPAGYDSVNFSIGWLGAVCLYVILLLTTSLTVSVSVRKKGAHSTYPTGIESKKPTICSYYLLSFGINNYTDGILFSLNQMHMYASFRSTLL